jgi:transposase
VRSYIRQRDNLMEESSRHVLRAQKALEQMNIQLHKVISDITGKTGQAILDAIIAGERDAEKLAALRDRRCRRQPHEIAKALRGDWRKEHLFCLRQSVEMYKLVQAKMAECEQAALQCWETLAAHQPATTTEAPKLKLTKKDPPERPVLFRLVGLDVFAAEGLSRTLVPKLLAEVGLDMSPWPTEKHFASWAGVSPMNNITGGKRRRAGRPGKRSRVAQIFKLAAQGAANSKTALGAFYRRMRGRRGSGIANDATAHKIARVFYRMMKFGEAYVAQAADYYEEKYRDQLVKGAMRTLDRLGVNVTVAETT